MALAAENAPSAVTISPSLKSMLSSSGNFAGYPKLYHLRGAQAFDVACALAEQPAQDFLSMLPECRRGRAEFERRFGESHRACHQRQACACAMRQLHADASRLDLGFFEHLGYIIDGAVRHAGCLEKLEPLGLAAPLEHVGK